MMAPFDFAIPQARFHEDGRKKRPARRKATLGQMNRRVVRTVEVDGVEHTYHATKGWRSRKVPA